MNSVSIVIHYVELKKLKKLRKYLVYLCWYVKVYFYIDLHSI